MPFSRCDGLGSLSNREPQYQSQNTLVIDKNGRLRFAAISRRVLALPPELLAEIFIYCLPDDDFVQPQSTVAPLLLCSVCRHFRQIALSTPALWSSLGCGDIELTLHRDAGEVVRCWLARARKAPLSICLPDSGGEWENDSSRSVLRTVVALAPQWQHIALNVVVAWAETLPVADGKFPLLRKLEITVFGGLDLQVSFRDAPKLREVNAIIYHPVRHASTQLPWHQITTLRASCFLPNCLAILRDAPNLVTATFEVANLGSAVETTPIPPLNHLQSLSLVEVRDYVAPTTIMDVLAVLTAPALKSLTLQFTHSHLIVELDTAPFPSFVSRSSLQLHTLVLSLVSPADAALQCLKALPSLVTLKLQPMRVADMHTVLPQLTGHPDFLPKLESLHIMLGDRECAAHRAAVRVEDVVDLLRYRWAAAGITRLRSFDLGHDYEALAFDEALSSSSEFQRLAAEGMDLHVGLRRPAEIDWIRSPRMFTGF